MKLPSQSKIQSFPQYGLTPPLQSHLFPGFPLALLCSKADHTSPLCCEALPNCLQLNSITPDLPWCFLCKHVVASPGSLCRNPDGGPPQGPTCDIHMTQSSALNFPACVEPMTGHENLTLCGYCKPTSQLNDLDFYHLIGYHLTFIT